MKRRFSVFRMAIVAMTATTVCLGGGFVANAQNAPTSAPPPAVSAPPAAALPYGATEVVKMYQKGISKDVIVNYVRNTPFPYHLNADGIIYLQNLGIPPEITTTMIQRDGELQQQGMQQYYMQ